MKKPIQENKICIVKYKFLCNKKSFYGCALLTIEIKDYSLLNTIGIISFNPSVYEINLNLPYNEIEKLICKYKLDKGTNFLLTEKFYSSIKKLNKKYIEEIVNGNIVQLTKIVSEIISISEDNIKNKHEIEKVKLAQMSSEKFISNIENIQENKFYIKTKPVFDQQKGMPVYKLNTKKQIECEVTDKREIAQYIIKLLYGNNKKFVYGKIHEITKKNDKFYELNVSITPVIFTKFIVEKNQKIKLYR